MGTLTEEDLAPSAWISVKDKLPAIDQDVLCFYTISTKNEKNNQTYKYYVIGHIQYITEYSNGKSANWIERDYQPIEPTHWMPLPLPPQ